LWSCRDVRKRGESTKVGGTKEFEKVKGHTRDPG